jgi:hypothetical protein
MHECEQGGLSLAREFQRVDEQEDPYCDEGPNEQA